MLLQQAVLNIIVNAIDAVADLREGDRIVTVWTGSSGDNHARIRVRDQGRGLPPGSEAQVFEPFFSTKSTGLGMGLAIARSIVESHGGTISSKAIPPVSWSQSACLLRSWSRDRGAHRLSDRR